MEQQLEEEAGLRRYLLGEATLEEQVSIEARLFLDDEFSSQLKVVEDELIDDYAYEELTARERERVEARLLPKPGRREDLKIARAFKRYLAQNEDSDKWVTPPVTPAAADRSAPDTKEEPSPGKGFTSFLVSLFSRRPVVSYALAAAALIILSVAIWFSLESARRQGPSPEMQAQQPTPLPSKPVEREQPGGELQANQRSSEQVGGAQEEGGGRQVAGSGEQELQTERHDGRPRQATPPPRRTPSLVASFLILPGGVVRGPGNSEKVRLSPDTGTVVLRLPLVATGDFRHYRATLLEGDKAIYTRADLQPEADAEVKQVVAVEVPAHLLRPRRYKIKLGGVTADGQARDLNTYTFEVERP